MLPGHLSPQNVWFPVIPEAPAFLCPRPPVFTGCVLAHRLALALCLCSPLLSAWALGQSGGRSTCTSCFASFQARATEQDEEMPQAPVVCLSALKVHVEQQGGSQVHMPRHASFLSLHIWCERVQISHSWQILFFTNVCRRHSVLCQSKVSSELKLPESFTGTGCEQPGQASAWLLLGAQSTK